MSCTARTSTQPVSTQGNSAAMRTASSMSSASIRLKPASNSLVSVNGPSTMVRPVADAHRFGGRRALEHLGIEQPSVLAQLVGMGEAVAHLRVELPRRESVQQGAVGVDQDGEFHVGSSAGGVYAV